MFNCQLAPKLWALKTVPGDWGENLVRKELAMGASRISQWLKALAAEPGDPSWSPVTQTAEGENRCCRLSSDLCTHIMVLWSTHIHSHE